MSVIKKNLEGGITHVKRHWDDGTLDYEYYELNSKWHREDGPAWINYRCDGSKRCESYYLNGKYYSEEEYKLWLLNKEADEAIQEMLGV